MYEHSRDLDGDGQRVLNHQTFRFSFCREGGLCVIPVEIFLHMSSLSLRHSPIHRLHWSQAATLKMRIIESYYEYISHSFNSIHIKRQSNLRISDWCSSGHFEPPRTTSAVDPVASEAIVMPRSLLEDFESATGKMFTEIADRLNKGVASVTKGRSVRASIDDEWEFSLD